MYFSPVVYVIDDNEIDCLIVSKLLDTKMPFIKVISFLSADEALNTIKNPEDNPPTVPSLILLDINMPVKSGWDFLREFESLPISSRYKETKVIIFTSSIHPIDQQMAGQHACVINFIVKPLKKQDVDEKIYIHFQKNEI